MYVEVDGAGLDGNLTADEQLGQFWGNEPVMTWASAKEPIEKRETSKPSNP